MKFKHTSFHSIAPVDSQDSSIQSPVHPGFQRGGHRGNSTTGLNPSVAPPSPNIVVYTSPHD